MAMNTYASAARIPAVSPDGQKSLPDRGEIMRHLRAMFEPGAVIELRAIAHDGKIYSGYFDSWGKLSEHAYGLQSAAGVYVVMNSINPALLARAHNRARWLGRKDPTTSDKDITQRRWLLIDADPVRPSGISASAAEKQLVLAKVQAMREWLALEGWPQPLTGDSGNGGHLLYRVDLPADDGKLIERVLKALAFIFDDESVKVDTSVHNPARITKLYGTVARKGDDTPERPHRLARLIDVPEVLGVVTEKLLKAVAARLPDESKPIVGKKTHGKAFDLDRWISDHGLDVKGPSDWQGGRKWIFDVCPFDSDHRNGSAYLLQLPGGAIAAGCHHNGCQDKDWHTLRAMFEPNRPERHNGHRPDSPSLPASADGLLSIKTNDRHLREISAEALNALAQFNTPPVLFVRGGVLARVNVDEHGKPGIEALGESAMRGRLTRVANFYSEREALEGMITHRAVSPPLDVVRDLLALGAWPLPSLIGLTETPALRPDGSVITESGHDRATGLYYHPTPGLAVDPIPDNPTRAELDAARALLREPLVDFPFADDASEANTLALMLTPILRPALSGPVPLALINAPQPGTGKGLIAEVVSITATGRNVMMTPMSRGEELRKNITALLLGGDSIICFDNLAGMIYSPILASALTAREWKDRILGKSESPGIPQRATWIATGNAIQLGGDLPRRCYAINLDAKDSQPWARTGFRHADLLAWVTMNRGRLVAAALTLARGWYAAGCPAARVPTLGSFPDWPRVMGGILAHAGVTGFLGNLQEMYKQADEEGAQWEAFLLALAERFTDANKKPISVTVGELCKTLTAYPELQDAIPDIGEELLSNKGEIQPKFKKALGQALRHRAGRRHGESHARVERGKDDGHSKTASWRFFCGDCGDLGDTLRASRARAGGKSSNSALDTLPEEPLQPVPANPAVPANFAPGLLEGEI